jgi:hypothetical protein
MLASSTHINGLINLLPISGTGPAKMEAGPTGAANTETTLITCTRARCNHFFDSNSQAMLRFERFLPAVFPV